MIFIILLFVAALVIGFVLGFTLRRVIITRKERMAINYLRWMGTYTSKHNDKES